jgi:hypothetical protein
MKQLAIGTLVRHKDYDGSLGMIIAKNHPAIWRVEWYFRGGWGLPCDGGCTESELEIVF